MDADTPIDLRGIAKLLGVSPNTPNQWRQRGVLPDPDPEYKDLARPMWRKSSIIRWAQSTGRWPPGAIGRPEQWKPRRKPVASSRKAAASRVPAKSRKPSGFVTAEDMRGAIAPLVFQPPTIDSAA